MSTAQQLDLVGRCPRCGGALAPLEDLAARVSRAHVAIRDRRLAVPDSAMNDLVAVAAALRCRAKICHRELA
jgi:hypothetical protein